MKDRTASTTIISEEGKTFAINIVMGDEALGRVYIGGTQVRYLAFDSETPATQFRMLGLQKTEITYALWIFSENHFEGTGFCRVNLALLDVAEDDATFDQEIEESRIVLEVDRKGGTAPETRPKTYSERNALLKKRTIGERGQRGWAQKLCSVSPIKKWTHH